MKAVLVSLTFLLAQISIGQTFTTYSGEQVADLYFENPNEDLGFLKPLDERLRVKALNDGAEEVEVKMEFIDSWQGYEGLYVGAESEHFDADGEWHKGVSYLASFFPQNEWVESGESMEVYLSIAPEDSSFTDTLTLGLKITDVSDENNFALLWVHLNKEDPTSIDTPDNQQAQLSVFPNPAEDHLTIAYSGLFDSAVLEVTNIQGVRVFQSDIQQVDGTFQLAVDDWPAGMYFCSLQGEHGVVSQRFIVE